VADKPKVLQIDYYFFQNTGEHSPSAPVAQNRGRLVCPVF